MDDIHVFVNNLRFTADVIFITILSMVTAMISLSIDSDGFLSRLVACIYSIYLVVMLHKKDHVDHSFGYNTLWVFWIVKGVILKSLQLAQDGTIVYGAYGVSGQLSIFYSLLLFSLPCVAMSSVNISRRISKHIIAITGLYFVILCIIPNSDSNIVTAYHYTTMIRAICSVFTYVFVVKLQPKLDEKEKKREGVMTIFFMLFIFESQIIITVVIGFANILLVIIFGNSYKRFIESGRDVNDEDV